MSSTPHKLLPFPIAIWTTQTKMQNKESVVLSQRYDKTWTYITSTAEDDVSQGKQEFLESLESWWFLCVKGGTFHLPKEWISCCNNEKRGKQKHIPHFMLLFRQLFSRLQASVSHSQCSRTEMTGNKNLWHMFFSQYKSKSSCKQKPLSVYEMN